MRHIKNTISFSKQIITLYSGVFLIILTSYFVISENYQQISLQKDKINQIENIKFALYELNFKINQNEISKIALKISADSIDKSFYKLIDKSSPLYSLTLTDSTNRANLLLHQTDEEKRFYDAIKNWRFFMHLLDQSYVRNDIFYEYQEKITENELEKIHEKLTFTRQIISAKLSQIRANNLLEYQRMKKLYTIYFIVITFIDLLYIFYMYSYTRKIILSPLDTLVEESNKIVKGKLSLLQTNSPNSEINKVSSTINTLITENEDATNYIKEITSREEHQLLDFEKKYLKSRLFISIKEMQAELNSIAKEEKERKWISEGQAVISEILNKYSNNFEKLTTEIIQHLVKYTGSLQGGLFTVKKDDLENPLYLELVASYAYDRNKFLKKTINKGEGILGQVWIENKGLYLENIPNDHMEIKSFVGNANPKCILIETLIDNKEFYGIIELASLNPLKDYQRNFISKIAENIAATLATVENNNRNYKLLEESQHMTVKLQKQEEDSKQNLRKLKASQEEIKRREIQKANELKAFREQFNEEINTYKRLEIEKDTLIDDLQKGLLNAETDNQAIRNLKKEIESLESSNRKTVVDLEETIKIKEMRLVKFKKRIEKLQNDNLTK